MYSIRIRLFLLLACTISFSSACQGHQEHKMSESFNHEFECQLAGAGEQRLNDGIWVTFSILSNAPQPLKLLPWHTPLEGIFSRIYQIQDQQGNPLEYNGPLMKRPAPTPADYLTFNPAQKLTQTNDLSLAYQFEPGNEYRVSIQQLRLELLDSNNLPQSAQCSSNQLMIKIIE